MSYISRSFTCIILAVCLYVAGSVTTKTNNALADSLNMEIPLGGWKDISKAIQNIKKSLNKNEEHQPEAISEELSNSKAMVQEEEVKSSNSEFQQEKHQKKRNFALPPSRRNDVSF